MFFFKKFFVPLLLCLPPSFFVYPFVFYLFSFFIFYFSHKLFPSPPLLLQNQMDAPGTGHYDFYFNRQPKDDVKRYGPPLVINQGFLHPIKDLSSESSQAAFFVKQFKPLVQQLDAEVTKVAATHSINVEYYLDHKMDLDHLTSQIESDLKKVGAIQELNEGPIDDLEHLFDNLRLLTEESRKALRYLVKVFADEANSGELEVMLTAVMSLIFYAVYLNNKLVGPADYKKWGDDLDEQHPEVQTYPHDVILRTRYSLEKLGEVSPVQGMPIAVETPKAPSKRMRAPSTPNIFESKRRLVQKGTDLAQGSDKENISPNVRTLTVKTIPSPPSSVDLTIEPSTQGKKAVKVTGV